MLTMSLSVQKQVHPHPIFEKGSALVESLLIVGVMVTFMIGLPMIGKLIDLKQTTIQASRYAAWEKTVEPDLNETSAVQDIDTRFFMDAAAPIRSTRAPDTAKNFLWGGIRTGEDADDGSANANGGDTPPQSGNMELYQKAGITLTDGSVVSTAASAGEDGYVYTKAGKIVAKIGAFISPDGWDRGDPLRNGLVFTNVEARVKANALFSLGGDNCGGGDEGCISEGTAILIDGWSAADHEVIRDRVHGFVPTNRLHQLGNFISKIAILPMFDDLEHLDDAFGCVKTNIVPGTKDFAPVGQARLAPWAPLPGENC